MAYFPSENGHLCIIKFLYIKDIPQVVVFNIKLTFYNTLAFFIKQRFGIAPQYQSCHTGVSADGFVFEGHVPARLIKKFLAEKPAGAIGLAVPGMPIGSPGMEMDERITPYDVLQLNKDGSTSVYSHVSTLEK